MLTTNSISRPVSMFGVVVEICAGEAIRLEPKFFSVKDTIVKYFDFFYFKNLVHSHFRCCTLIIYMTYVKYQSIAVAARSKARVSGRSFAGIVGSNRVGDVGVCLLRAFCVVK